MSGRRQDSVDSASDVGRLRKKKDRGSLTMTIVKAVQIG
jgi:hypothetical protein